jgi:ABC-type taurine transport system substrate-binding protein
MISPSPIERHVEIARAFGLRARPLEEAAHRSLLRRLRRHRTAQVDGIEAPITIRPASVQDAPAIARLAVLDGHRLPAGEQLVAEAGGHILAAADVASGRTVADPFQPTAGVARLVALRAEQLRQGDFARPARAA